MVHARHRHISARLHRRIDERVSCPETVVGAAARGERATDVLRSRRVPPVQAVTALCILRKLIGQQLHRRKSHQSSVRLS